MTEQDVEVVLQRGRERHPMARPRIISDNGPQFIAKDFKEFIRLAGMTHVRTAPYYPQSNGKLERWHKTIKADAIRVSPPSSLAEARALVARFVAYYNGVRLHSAIGYIAPNDFLAGRAETIWAERDRKLEAAREPAALQACSCSWRSAESRAPMTTVSPLSLQPAVSFTLNQYSSARTSSRPWYGCATTWRWARS